MKSTSDRTHHTIRPWPDVTRSFGVMGITDASTVAPHSRSSSGPLEAVSRSANPKGGRCMGIGEFTGLSRAEAKNPHLGAVIGVSEFPSTTGVLTTSQRRRIVDQALVLIDDVYVHLRLKRAMHPVAPVQALKLLRRKVNTISERQSVQQ